MKVNPFFALLLIPFLTFLPITSKAATQQQSDSYKTNSQESDAQEKEGKALKLLMIVNMDEVKAGKLALQKSTNSDVKQFAQMMVKDHSQNLKLIQALSQKTHIKPVDSDKAKDLMEKGKKEGDKLKEEKGKDFDVAYMDAMVNGHKDVLKIIDDKLLPDTSNPKLKDYLNATRAKVSEHLKMAEDIKSKL